MFYINGVSSAKSRSPFDSSPFRDGIATVEDRMSKKSESQLDVWNG